MRSFCRTVLVVIGLFIVFFIVRQFMSENNKEEIGTLLDRIRLNEV
jgi:hypothetical protein